jgi:hypothetical protein
MCIQMQNINDKYTLLYNILLMKKYPKLHTLDVKHDKTQFIFLLWNLGYEAQRQREKLHK